MLNFIFIILTSISNNVDATLNNKTQQTVKTDHYNVFIHKADKYNIDPQLLLSICYAESTFKTNVVNKNSGASGICQLLPRYHKMDNYFNAKSNIDKASEYISQLTEKCKGNNYCIINSYNVGYYGFKNKNYKNHSYYNKVMFYYNNYNFDST